MTAQRAYVPAAGHDRWLRFYDPLTRLLGAPSALRTLIEQVGLQSGHRVLEIGCGTGNLALMLMQRRADVEVCGLDPDPSALERARRKADRAAIDIEWVLGFADTIPYLDASFDRVVSSFMLHHLSRAEKHATLVDVHRVLKPGGSFHLVDFARPDHPRGVVARLLHRDDHLRDHTEGGISAMLDAAGFTSAIRVGLKATLFGPISFYRADR